MSSEVTIQAVRRAVTGKQVKALRREGLLPAIIYGRHIAPTPIQMDYRDATHTLRTLTSSHLIRLVVEGQPHTVLVRDKQYDVLKGNLMHVDFQAVSMDEKLTTTVPVRLVGVAPAVKEFDAMLMTELNELEVEAFPGDLPEIIDVDISKLTELGDTITVADLTLGDKVKLLHEPDEVIAIAISAAAAEEVEEVEAAAEPEVIQKGKEEDEEEEEE